MDGTDRIGDMSSLLWWSYGINVNEEAFEALRDVSYPNSAPVVADISRNLDEPLRSELHRLT